MGIRIPNNSLRYMKAHNKSHAHKKRNLLTMNTIIITPDLLARPPFDLEPPVNVIREIDNTTEGGHLMTEHLHAALDGMSNALVELVRVFLTPESFPNGEPAFAEVMLVFADGIDTNVILPTEQINAVGLHKAIPRFFVPRKHRDTFDLALTDIIHQLVNLSASNLVQVPVGSAPSIGYVFSKPGLQQLPNGEFVFILSDQLLGTCNLPYIVRCNEGFHTHSLPISDPLPQLFAELEYADPQVTLGVAFVCSTLLRSWIMKITDSWQAVLSIVGGQGLGKTTLVRRLTDWITDSDGDPALLFSAGSTPSAIRDAMATIRDLPLVIDDLCLSASPQLQRKYRDLGAQFVREGVNAAPIVKKLPGGKSTKVKCAAGIILTAEFALENASDITRCIFLNIDQPLRLPQSLSTELLGSAYAQFLQWFMPRELKIAKELVKPNPDTRSGLLHPRVKANFDILDTLFKAMAYATLAAGAPRKRVDAVYARFCIAVDASMRYQEHLLDKLDRQRKKGNIAFVLLNGLEQGAFKLCTKIEKLDRREGIIWHGDLCLRLDPLERFVRLQDGYNGYNITKIVRELKDIGALVIQEDGTAQVRLKKGTPRVYRIIYDVLKDAAINYEEGSCHD